jgi:RNA polymerase sporulation-specific sigma factor
MADTKQQLMEDNVKLVRFLIGKYYPQWVGDEDLIQVGMVGLCEAANYWNDNKETMFTTYASKVILNEVKDEFKNRIKENEIQSCSLGTILYDDNDMTLEDVLADEQCLEYANTSIEFNEFLDTLNERERQIIKLRLRGLLQDDIADILGVSRQAVSQQLIKLKNKWRYRYGNN